MKLLKTIKDTRRCLNECRLSGQSIGLVPTMGNLHDGHLELVRQAMQECDVVIVSIFVNPLQFSVNEDFSEYPRTLMDDMAKLKDVGVQYVFAPNEVEMGPKDTCGTVVDIPALSGLLCGVSRPHFFKGVATVVTKLFNIIHPDKAYFGEKDFQQLTIIRQVVRDLRYSIDIVPVATQRNDEGLAMSSRNQYLTVEQRHQARFIYQSLLNTKSRILMEFEDFRRLESEATAFLNSKGFVVDYFSICQRDTLEAAEYRDRDIVIFVAANLGAARLIDNIGFNYPFSQ